jgi:hypothetical protein
MQLASCIFRYESSKTMQLPSNFFVTFFIERLLSIRDMQTMGSFGRGVAVAAMVK